MDKKLSEDHSTCLQHDSDDRVDETGSTTGLSTASPKDCKLSCHTFLKRLLLCIPIGVIVTSQLIPEDIFYSVWVLSPLSFISSWALFINFPQLAGWIHTKPLYVEDLRVQHRKQQLFLTWYTQVSNFLLAIVMMGVIDYTFAIQKQHENKKTVMEVCGIIGGVLALYLKIESVVGMCILHFVYRIKEHEVYRSHSDL